jgi:hypothetical protein
MNIESECKEIGRVAGCREDVFRYLEITFADLKEDVRFEKLSDKSGYYDRVSLYKFAARVDLNAYSCRIAHPYTILRILRQFVAERGTLLSTSVSDYIYDDITNPANVYKSRERSPDPGRYKACEWWHSDLSAEAALQRKRKNTTVL